MSRLTESDKKIQQFLEQGLKIEAENSELNSFEVDAYKIIFDALDKKPAEGLPYRFASKVVVEIQSRDNIRFLFRRQVLVPVFLFIAIAVCYFALSFIDESIAERILNIVLTYKWIVVFGISSYLIIEYLNYRLVGKQ